MLPIGESNMLPHVSRNNSLKGLKRSSISQTLNKNQILQSMFLYEITKKLTLKLSQNAF